MNVPRSTSLTGFGPTGLARASLGRSLVLTGLAAAAGCAPAHHFDLAPLDEPVTLYGAGSDRSSSVTLYRRGVLDAAAARVILAVTDLDLRAVTDGSRASVEELRLTLGDTDIAPSATLPDGIKLRRQSLSLAAPMEGAMLTSAPEGMTARVHGALVYQASMVLDDGSLYRLGPVASEPGDLELRATRFESGVHVALHAAPQGRCWSVPGLLEVEDCTLTVASEGDAASR